jgi:hypothetical protein
MVSLLLRGHIDRLERELEGVAKVSPSICRLIDQSQYGSALGPFGSGIAFCLSFGEDEQQH